MTEPTPHRPSAIVVPVYNAAATLPDVLARIPSDLLEEATLIVVNDGSTDGTVAFLTELSRSMPADRLVVRHHAANRGYGAAQKTGFTTALAVGASAVTLLHADGQYQPEELPDLLAPILAGDADVVIGSRVIAGGRRQGMPVSRYLGNRALSWVENRVFGLRFAEYHTGAMAYSRAALEALPFGRLSDRFHFDGEMMLCAARLGLQLAEVPITHYTGPDVSSLDPVAYVREVAWVLWRYSRGYYDTILFDRGAEPRR